MMAKVFKFIFHSLFLTANIVVVILFIMSAFSYKVAPEKNLLFSYLGLAFPIICFINLCFVIYWIFLLEWKYLWISILSFVICWKPVVEYFPFHGKTKTLPEENMIKVLTYNVMGFAYKDHTIDEPNEIVQYIIDSEADIVCMQEYVVYKSAKLMTEEKLKKALHMYPYRSVIPMNSNKHHVSGLAVYSKYPIFKSRKIEYDSNDNGSSIHEINVNGKKLTLINNHLESFKLTSDDKSKYKEFINSVGTETFDGLRGTIQQKLGPAFIKRGSQARAVAGEIEKVDTDYILVCGDFNDTPISYAHHIIQGPLQDAFVTSGRGFGVTYNENFFWFRIDHILYSPNMKAYNCTVGNVKYSDHYPVWCYLELE